VLIPGAERAGRVVVSLVAGFGMDTFAVLEIAGPRIAVGGVNHPFA
jgi:hypothetical protein